MNYNGLRDYYYKRDTKYVKSLPIYGTLWPDYYTVPIDNKTDFLASEFLRWDFEDGFSYRCLRIYQKI